MSTGPCGFIGVRARYYVLRGGQHNQNTVYHCKCASPFHYATSSIDFGILRYTIDQTMLERLRDRAKIAFAQFQSGLGPQPAVDESEFPDDVAIISGRASVINRSGSSQSPNSTSRLSESPQSMPMGISGVAGTTTSPNTSPVVSDARVYNVHGNVNMSMGDVMQDLGLEYYSPTHPHQHSQYMNGMNGAGGVNGAGMNGVGGMNGLGASGMVGMNGMNGMNGINGTMSHGNGGMLPPPPAHLGMDQMYKDPHSQQQYMMVRIPLIVCCAF